MISNIKKPNFYTETKTGNQETCLTNSNQKVLFVTKDSNQNVQQPVNIYNFIQVRKIFGRDSQTERMLSSAIKTNKKINVQILSQNFLLKCNNATSEACLNINNSIKYPNKGFTFPKFSIYINNELIAQDISTESFDDFESYHYSLDELWYFNTTLSNHAKNLGYVVLGSSEQEDTFINQSTKPIQFKFVPSSYEKNNYYDESYTKNFLIIDENNQNPTAMKDSETGIITFYLAGANQ